MTAMPNLTASASAYVEITRSNITANLFQFGTSSITRGHQQNLTLDPGTFSEDPDASTFNASVRFDWRHTDHSTSSFHIRIGRMTTTVVFMVIIISLIFTGYIYLSIIPQSIQWIPPVYLHNQVPLNCFNPICLYKILSSKVIWRHGNTMSEVFHPNHPSLFWLIHSPPIKPTNSWFKW